jgi:hypothetical protein
MASIRASPAEGPSRIATATARSLDHGRALRPTRTSYSFTFFLLELFRLVRCRLWQTGFSNHSNLAFWGSLRLNISILLRTFSSCCTEPRSVCWAPSRPKPKGTSLESARAQSHEAPTIPRLPPKSLRLIVNPGEIPGVCFESHRHDSPMPTCAPRGRRLTASVSGVRLRLLLPSLADRASASSSGAWRQCDRASGFRSMIRSVVRLFPCSQGTAR